MSYEELLNVWRTEKKSRGLSELPRDFYRRAAELIAEMRSGLKMLDKGTIKARLTMTELANVEKMLKDIFWTRMDKAIRDLRIRGSLELEKLTLEERALIEPLEASFSALESFLEALLRGDLKEVGYRPRGAVEKRQEGLGVIRPGQGKLLVRILSDVPALVGADMKVHGPFKRGDVAFIPSENALILIRRGMAIEVKLP